jgi:monovalent cation:proton antiporter-2 (CPA2) family protein
MDNSLLKLGIIFLTAAVTIVPLFKRMGLGSVLGYLAAGSIIGPWGLKFFSNAESIIHVAEFGVVILLFLIGLELKPSRLWVMRKAVFGLGGAQVLLTTLAIFPLTLILGLSLTSSIIVGISFSLSSTAFAIQLMAEKKQLNTQFGRSAFAVLLFQDIAAIPVLAMIPFLAMEKMEFTSHSFIKVAAVFGILGALILGGKFVLKPLFRIAANTRTREIFTAASLLVILAVSYLMYSIELSMALGSFIAGLLLSDSEYRHQIETDLEPFKGLLLGLFFIGVGMSVDYGLIGEQPGFIVSALIIYFIIKFSILFGLGKFSKLNNLSSQNLALSLSQGGEFAFVLLGLAMQNKLIDSTTNNISTIIITLSMVLTSLFSTLLDKLQTLSKNKKSLEFDKIEDIHAPVIIAGFGRVGQVAGRILRVLGIDFTALELDAEQVDAVRRFGYKIYYGDASRLDLLETAGASKAKVLILALDEMDESLKVAEIVKEHFPNLKVLARARNREHVFRLRDHGVEHIWRETWSSSVKMARSMLSELGFPSEKIEKVISSFEENDLTLLNEQYEVYNDERHLIDKSKAAVAQLTQLLNEDEKQT